MKEVTDIKMIIFVLIKICSFIQLTNAQGNKYYQLDLRTDLSTLLIK